MIIDQKLKNLVCDYDESKIEAFCHNNNSFYKTCIADPKVRDFDKEEAAEFEGFLMDLGNLLAERVKEKPLDSDVQNK